MARYVTEIPSRLSQSEAFAYMANFTNALFWDPSVSEAHATSDGPPALGSTFDLVARFGGRDVPLQYTIVDFEPSKRVVLEATRPGFTSRDTITVEPADDGSLVGYDAVLAFNGVGKLLDPVMNLVFARIGAKASAGLRAALNP